MFVAKGYCRFCRSKCWHFKLEDGTGLCKHKVWIGGENTIRNKNFTPKNISSDKNVNIKAPSWCPKLKH